MICQALRISIFNSFHSVTRITYNVHKILQGVPKKWAQSDPKWPRPSERTWMAQSGPKWPKIPASHHSPQNFKSTFFLGHPVCPIIARPCLLHIRSKRKGAKGIPQSFTLCQVLIFQSGFLLHLSPSIWSPHNIFHAG